MTGATEEQGPDSSGGGAGSAAPIDAATLTAFLSGQRWFAGKGRGWQLAGTSTIGSLPGDPQVRIDAVAVRYDDGEVDTYQLPLVLRAEPVEALGHALVAEVAAEDGSPRWVYDALHDKEVTGRWLDGIAAAGGEDAGATGGLVFHRPGAGGEVPVGATSLVLGAEQSNTSLVFDDVAMLKVFRRLQPGLNPDIEVHEALLGAGSEQIAAPLGSVAGSWTDPVDAAPVTGSLAMLQVFLRGATEGWELAKASVRDLFAEGDLHADEVGGDFAGEAYRLGSATASVHAALARSLGTAVLDRDELEQRAAAMRARLDRAAAEVPALAPHVEALRTAYAELSRLTEPVPVQRVHGDYHLGQVMRTTEGWRLLDFEGEPIKSLAERRAPDSPLRDVAGMLRSFDYAARHLIADQAHGPHLDYRANEWATRNRDAFCQGYAQGSGADPRDQDLLLGALETDKAVYEVVYEARNRPTWIHIPLSAIERLAAAK